MRKLPAWLGMKPIRLNPLWIALLVGLINGLVFVYLVPPWQHYDEPNHFEVAWLLARRGSLPAASDVDPGMRLQVAQSMLDHGFFKDMAYKPDLSGATGPAWIGAYSQLSNPPVYYLLAAGPVWLMGGFSVDDQLYAARLVSLLLFLLTIAAAWGLSAELTAPGHPLRLLVPLCVALFPTLADNMTSVNNDAAAVAFMSLFLWGGVRLVRRGGPPWVWLFTGLVALLAIGSKESAFIAAPLLAVFVLFAILGGRIRWLAWAALAAGGVVIALVVLDWGDASGWARRTFQEAPTWGSGQAPALVIQAGGGLEPPYRVTQFLVPEQAAGLQGKEITLGAWMWASRPVVISMPELYVYESGRSYSRRVEVGTTPAYYALTGKVRGPSARAWITLDVAVAPQDPALTVYYSGVVLAEGRFDASQEPVFDSPDGSIGTWGGLAFTNLVRNGLGAQAGLRVRPWADRLGAAVLPDGTRPAWALATLLDWRATGWYYRTVVENLFRTFWGVFGWGHVELAGAKPFRVTLGLGLLAVLGSGLALAKTWRRLAWDVVFILGLGVAAAWGLAVVRSSPFLLFRIYLPPARNTFPLILPVLYFLAAGWDGLVALASGRARLAAALRIAVGVLPVLALDLWAIFSIGMYYYG